MKVTYQDGDHEPADIDVQEAILGALLLDNKLIDVAASTLEPEHFYDELHQRIYAMIVHLQTEGVVTPHILHSVMKTDPGLVELGKNAGDTGLTYLLNLVRAAPSRPIIPALAQVVIDLATRRQMIDIALNLANDSLSPPATHPTKTTGDTAMEALLRVGRDTRRPILSPYELATASLHDVEAMQSGASTALVKTGLENLDDEIGGARGGDLILVPAKSGMGKSALMGGLAKNFVLPPPERPVVPTIFFSLEMTGQQVVERMVCDIDFDTATKPMWYSHIRNGRITGAEFSRFGDAMQRLHGIPLEIVDEDGLTIEQIASHARAFKAKWGLNPDGTPRTGVVLIDYAQIVTPVDVRGQSREQQVASIARGAKALAKRLNWPVIMGSQLNEEDQKRAQQFQRPQASDVRESKALMNEADLMLSPYRPAVAILNQKPLDAIPGDSADLIWKGNLRAVINRMELLMLKNRHGRRKDLELFCDMGASAIRAAKPYRSTPEDEAADDLLKGLI